MASFLPGPVIAAASGSVGGTVFSHNRDGMYMRNRSIPVNPRTVRQEDQRALMSQLTYHWKVTLTAAQREAWEIYAAGSPVVNKLGQARPLVGQMMYNKTNLSYVAAGGTRIDNAPSQMGLALYPTMTFTADTADGIVLTAITPAPGAGDVIRFFVSPPKPFTVNFFGKGFYKTVNNLGTLTLPFEIVAPADVAIGQRFFIETIFIEADGRPTNRFQERFDITA